MYLDEDLTKTETVWPAVTSPVMNGLHRTEVMTGLGVARELVLRPLSERCGPSLEPQPV